MRGAACLGLPSTWFFREGRGGNSRRAKSICASCPVRRSCLERALALEEGLDANVRSGVVGGLGPDERHALSTSRLLDSGIRVG
jgi:WhiB family redox-sensing transcriptional regulator